MLQEELGHLAALWTMISRVMDQFSQWKDMPWDAIDVDFLIEETKKLLKDIKTLNKAIRSYPAYKCGSPSFLCGLWHSGGELSCQKQWKLQFKNISALHSCLSGVSS